MTDLLGAITEQDRLYRQATAKSLENNGLNINVPQVNYGDAWKLTGDFMLVGDVHVPSTRWDLAALVGDVAKKYLRKPRRLIIAGDLFNFDKFSMFPHITMPPTWAQERDSARELLSVWAKTFDEIYYFSGNHERRLQKIMLAVFEDATDMMSLLVNNPKKYKFSNFSYCFLDDWLIVHPRNYSRNQLTVANKLSAKYRMNVMSFHEHHTALGFDDSGTNMIINVGSLVDPTKVAYMHLDISTAPMNTNSFVMYRNGIPTLFGPPPLTDWTLWIKS